MNVREAPQAKASQAQPSETKPRYGIDPYLDWLAGEGIPVTEDYGVDLFAVETAPWPRYGVNGAAVHLKGRGGFAHMFLVHIGPRQSTAPARPRRRAAPSTKNALAFSEAAAGRGSNLPAAAGAASSGAKKACSLFRLMPSTATLTAAALNARLLSARPICRW